MIRQLTFETNEQALRLLQLQMSAYRIEAELIGLAEIPPLKDSISSIRDAREEFFGYHEGEELAGAISFVREGDAVTICRVMVDPRHFRKSIASALLEHTFAVQRTASRFIVSTAALNVPAIGLYERFGFRECGRREISQGIELITFMKRAETGKELSG